MDRGYREFREAMLQQMRTSLQGGEPFEVRTDKVEKCSRTMEVLIVRRRKEPVSPVFYLEQLYQNYLNGRTVPEICEDITSFLLGHQAPELSGRPTEDYGEAKKTLQVRLLSREANQRYLDQGPYRTMTLGMAVVYAAVKNSAGKVLETRVTNGMLAGYGVTDDQLFEDAMAHTRTKCPFIFSSLDSVIQNAIGVKPGGIWEPGPEIYVLTNRENWYGAAVALYPGTLQKVREMVGEDFYILPASVHELLVIKKSAVQGPGILREMVRSVNREHEIGRAHV